MAAAEEAAGPAERLESDVLSLNVLSTIRTMQQLHGMRSYDYGRYKEYCTRRLKRLHKTLHWTHKAGKRFQKRKVEPEDCSESRFLVIMLLLVERAWAHGEELKAEWGKKADSRVGRHYRSRMRKAEQRAVEMCEVASYCCDERTQKEMQAYRCEMSAHSCFSVADWGGAKKTYAQARTSYMELSKGQGSELRAVLLARTATVDHAIRYCMHKLGEDPSGWKVAEDSEIQEVTGGLDFLGKRVSVHSDKVRALLTLCEQGLVEVQRVRQQLSSGEEEQPVAEEKPAWKRRASKRQRQGPASTQSGALNRLVDAYDKVFMAINDAISQVKQDIEQEKGGDAAGLHMLHNCLKYRLYQHTLGRNQIMCAVHTARYESQEAGTTMAGVKPTTPLDLARLHDTVRNTVEDLISIPGVEDSPEGNELIALQYLHAGLKAHFQGEAFRVTCRDWPHAALMYEEATKELQQGFMLCKQEQLREKEREITAASQRVQVAQLLNRAMATWGKRKAEDDLGAALQKKARISADEPAATLESCLDSYEPSSCFTQMPPQLLSMPCRPIFLDIAFELLPQASIDHRCTQATKESKRKERGTRAKDTAVAAAGPPAAAADSAPGVGDDGTKKGWFGGWGWGAKK
eukprot:TRINITY_DN7567_c0_g1_i1.p1 TRINITY_DN7567_c0_g1~~TRINITY_DN7567_c0_g1_i1.p1  ORF type:complete len:631 (+),score=219.36 TRINITY_DN7567_c0_g1_i1:79-1971(+)